MNEYPRVYNHGKVWKEKRNGVVERRRRRSQVRSAESFPWSHGRKSYPVGSIGYESYHGNLRNTVTLRGVKCTGAPVYTGPREVSNNLGPVMNDFHHRHWINYQTSANSTNAPSQVNLTRGSTWDQRRVCEGQQVSLRPSMWSGSTPRIEEYRLITPVKGDSQDYIS